MIHFSKALNRSFISSMNGLFYYAKVSLTQGDLAPHDVSFKLNKIPILSLGSTNPRESLKSLKLEPRVAQ